MESPIYVGDEVSAAGFRLAGALVVVPEPGRAAEALRDACARAPLVLVSAATAAQIPAEELARAAAAIAPLTVIVPDPVGGVPVPDLAKRLRGQLGMEG